jgi:hypothetical protein
MSRPGSAAITLDRDPLSSLTAFTWPDRGGHLEEGARVIVSFERSANDPEKVVDVRPAP